MFASNSLGIGLNWKKVPTAPTTRGVTILAEWDADASIIDIVREQIGSCPHRNDAQLYTRCDPYCPTLAQLFSPYGRGLCPNEAGAGADHLHAPAGLFADASAGSGAVSARSAGHDRRGAAPGERSDRVAAQHNRRKKMRILFSAVPAHGHVLPMMPWVRLVSYVTATCLQTNDVGFGSSRLLRSQS